MQSLQINICVSQMKLRHKPAHGTVQRLLRFESLDDRLM